jgi:hypothetical protein
VSKKSLIYSKILNSSPIIIGRVTDILLDLNDDIKKEKFNDLFPGNLAIGSIEFELIINLNSISIGYARPLFSNIKQYPLINETVLLIQGPSYNTPEDSTSTELYYISTYNTFNSSHINPQPIIENNGIINSNELNYIFGKTFNINPNIQSLLPFEGDSIIEGRFGNSIRMGSTISGSQLLNQWSQEGNGGNPITIIRNGQTYNESNIDFTLEDINTDLSSIYECSTQVIPIVLSSNNFKSFNITLDKTNIPTVNTPNIDDNNTSLYDNIGDG